jgi:hypothetical protein
MTQYLLNVLSTQVQDELPMVINDSFKGIDPVWSRINQTSIGVVSSETAQMNYKWQVNHTFEGGLAGNMVPGDTNPAIMDDTLYSGMGTKFLNTATLGGTTGGFPTATDSPHAGVWERKLNLHVTKGNFPVPVQWLQMDKLSATHIKQIAMDIKAIGKLRAQMEAISFFCKKVNAVPTLGSPAADVVILDNDKTATITITDGRISYFYPGMLIDAVASNALTTSLFDGVVMVSAVNYLAKTITIVGGGALSNVELNDGGVTLSASGATKALLIWRGTSQYRPLVSWGLEDWIKPGAVSGADRYAFQTAIDAGGIDLLAHPEMASQIVAVDGALTDTVLNGYVGGFIDAYGDAAPDTILTTWGTTLKYIQAPNASGLDRMMFDRQAAALTVKGGFSTVSFVFNGRNMEWMTSSLVLPGTLYGLKLRDNNIKRYVPPRVGGSDSRIGAEVEFLAPLGGHSGIFKIAHAASGASLEMLEAPFWQYRLIAALDPRSIKLTGLTEATMV